MCRCTPTYTCDVHQAHDEKKLGWIASLVAQGNLEIDTLITAIFLLEDLKTKKD